MCAISDHVKMYKRLDLCIVATSIYPTLAILKAEREGGKGKGRGREEGRGRGRKGEGGKEAYVISPDVGRYPDQDFRESHQSLPHSRAVRHREVAIYMHAQVRGKEDANNVSVNSVHDCVLNDVITGRKVF